MSMPISGFSDIFKFPVSSSARWTEHKSPITAQHLIARVELPTSMRHVIL